MKLSGKDVSVLNMNMQILMVILSNIRFKDQLVDEVAELKHELSRYEAVGILDGNSTYFRKMNEIKARIKRISVLIEIIDIWEETELEIKEGNYFIY